MCKCHVSRVRLERSIVDALLNIDADCEPAYEHTVTGDALRSLLKSSLTSNYKPNNGLALRCNDVDSDSEFDTLLPVNYRLVHCEKLRSSAFYMSKLFDVLSDAVDSK